MPTDVAAASATVLSPTSADWPVDVQRLNATGEVDLGQLEFNLGLTPTERIRQNDAWVLFLAMVRSGKSHDDRPAST